MREISRAPAGWALAGLLAVGWVIGLVVHRESAMATGYMDISLELLLLGAGLLTLAGAAARLLVPASARVRTGAAVSTLLGSAGWLVADRLRRRSP